MRSYDVNVIRHLRAVWDAPPASPTPPRLIWRDIALLVALPLFVGLEVAARWGLPWLGLTAPVLLALVPLLLVRRTRPLLAFLIAFGLMSVVTVLGSDQNILYSTVFVALFPYALFRWGSGRAVTVGLALMFVSFVLTELVPPIVLEDAIGGGVITLVILTLALTFRFRSSARQRGVDQVRLLERERLARDLHDSVAHHVSAITVTAQAGIETARTNPGAAVEALTVIEKEASLTLADMRRMVGILRVEDSPALEPVARVTELESFLNREGVTPPVEVELRGDVDSLLPAVSAAVYRIAQEAVTNARRHAKGASRIRISVERDDAGVCLDVTDDGELAARATPGFGITGMIERATLLGGTCTAGPAAGGGWTVRATLPTLGRAV